MLNVPNESTATRAPLGAHDGPQGTGMTHYTTFDGKCWHYHDGNSRKPTRITTYKSTVRDFVVQEEVVGNPAITCALAGREGHDRVIINACDGNVTVETDFHTQKAEDQPRIDVNGTTHSHWGPITTHTVHFKSGAWMRCQVTRWGMNVYVESVDPGESCGTCGDFDGDPANDAVAYSVRDYYQLKACQKVGGAMCTVGPNSGDTNPCDIWDYKPEDNPAKPAAPALISVDSDINSGGGCANRRQCGIKLELKDGASTSVTFSLSRPIACPEGFAGECVVVVNVSNSHPDWVAISPCLLRWTAGDWQTPQNITVTAKRGPPTYRQHHLSNGKRADYDTAWPNADREVLLATQVLSTAAAYSTATAQDLHVVTRKRPAAQCRSTGSAASHTTTFDGKYWHFYDGATRARSPVRNVSVLHVGSVQGMCTAIKPSRNECAKYHDDRSGWGNNNYS